MAAGCSAGSNGDGKQLTRFVPKAVELVAEFCVELEVSASIQIPQEFEPKGGFVGFFFDDPQFGDEIRSGFGAARGSVVGTDGRCRAPKLAEHVAGF
jgi:hypothetical protein